MNKKQQELYTLAEFGKLSSGILHDIVNLLSALGLHIEQMSDTVDPQYHHSMKYHIAHITNINSRVTSLISRLQNYTKPQKIKTLFNPAQEIQDAYALFAHKIRDIRITCKNKLDTSIKIHNDAIQFQRIITNLLSNALDACEHATTKEISLSLSLMTYNEQKAICMCVSDSGAGIPADILPKIFNPFFTTKSLEKGSGIGLSQSKDIIENTFGGAIYVDSFLGKGSTFTVLLPYATT